MRHLIGMSLLLLSGVNYAKNLVDIYGTDAQNSAHILKKYAQEIEYIESQIIADFFVPHHDKNTERKLACFIAKQKKVLAQIKKEMHFAYVDLETIFYPGDRAYTTIEVIENPHADRMHFIRPKAQWFSRIREKLNRMFPKQDLITNMQNYEQEVTQLSLHQELKVEDLDCPAYHCLSGFHHPHLKPYWPIFQEGVIQQKTFILHALKADPIPERRAAAAYLVGYFSNPNEIVARLIPHIYDAAPEVRNHVLRVIALTLTKAQLSSQDPLPFIRLLDSPYGTDRNKALTILLVLANDPLNKKTIKRYGIDKIKNLAALKQPDNHDFAEALLKKLNR